MSNPKNIKYSFRTEMEADNERVPELMRVLGLSISGYRSVSDNLLSEYKMGVFCFESQMSLSELEQLFEAEIETNELFVDMHRCYQTLAVGEEPNEKWYLKPERP